MNNYKIFCMCLHEHHLINIKKLNYTPVGLGKNNFSTNWLRDNTGDNISEKNPYYGEYTFYYWYWKNMLHKHIDGSWIGFSGYRYHWAQENTISSDLITKNVNNNNYNNFILKNIPKEWNSYEVILGEEIFIDKWKLSKIFKHCKKKLLKKPLAFLKHNQNIELHFDIFHGDGNLNRAINVLEEKDREDFRKFVKEKKSFNRENLFFCKSNKLMDAYFSSVFKWLKNCENIFGFNLEGYSMTRIYAFLAERYLAYWFNKYTKPLSWPIFFYDTNKNKINI
jgi:hypothetical protein